MGAYDARMRLRLSALIIAAFAMTSCAADLEPATSPTAPAPAVTIEPEPAVAPEPEPTASGPVPLASDTEPEPADINFAQMMIGHHLQAIELVDLARELSSNSELLALADEIEAAQGPEIEQMSWWVAKEWGYEVLDPADHEGHAMPGMMTRDELNELATRTGADFDRAWLEAMIFHHEGAVDMANDELSAGAVSEVREMAQEVITVQEGEITVMREMIDDLER